MADDIGLALNRLAREQLKRRLYADILADLTVCEIEGWSKSEYIGELYKLIDDLASNVGSAKNGRDIPNQGENVYRSKDGVQHGEIHGKQQVLQAQMDEDCGQYQEM